MTDQTIEVAAQAEAAGLLLCQHAATGFCSCPHDKRPAVAARIAELLAKNDQMSKDWYVTQQQRMELFDKLADAQRQLELARTNLERNGRCDRCGVSWDTATYQMCPVCVMDMASDTLRQQLADAQREIGLQKNRALVAEATVAQGWSDRYADAQREIERLKDALEQRAFSPLTNLEAENAALRRALAPFAKCLLMEGAPCGGCAGCDARAALEQK